MWKMIVETKSYFYIYNSRNKTNADPNNLDSDEDDDDFQEGDVEE